MRSGPGPEETRSEQHIAGQTDFYEGRPDTERGERLAAFIESMEAAAPPFLRELEKEALAEGIPIIRPRTQGLLRFFINMTLPGRILEVGTATGFSALLMDVESLESSCSIRAVTCLTSWE